MLMKIIGYQIDRAEPPKLNEVMPEAEKLMVNARIVKSKTKKRLSWEKMSEKSFLGD